MLTTLRPRLKDEGCRDLVGKLMVVNFVIFAIMLGGLVGGRLKGFRYRLGAEWRVFRREEIIRVLGRKLVCFFDDLFWLLCASVYGNVAPCPDLVNNDPSVYVCAVVPP